MGRRIFEAVMGIVLIIVAVVLAYLFQQAYSRGVELQSLPVPISEIPPYAILTEGMFEYKDFPRALGGGYASDLTQLSGRVSKSGIPPGLPVPLAMVSSPQDFRLADPSLEVLAIPVVPETAVGGQIRIGERVNIYRLVPPPSTLDLTGPDALGRKYASLIAEDVPVVNVLSGEGDPDRVTESGSTVPTEILVVAVNTEQRNAILNLIAETEQNALLWVSLAPVKE